MREYILTDIHYHTNDSFDAYENDSKQPYSTNLVSNATSSKYNKKVKLLCKTDHNVLDYNNYLTLEAAFMVDGIKILPGIEVNTTDKVHWIFVFDDSELSEETGTQTKGELLDGIIKQIYGYVTLCGTIAERRMAQNNKIDIGQFISKINKLGLSYLAIPHFNKNKGWYDILKRDKSKIDIINYLISDNIIVGFESKNQEIDLINQIKETEFYLGTTIIEFENGNITDLNEITRRKEHLDFLNDLKEMFDENDTSIIYGSDYHGDGSYNIDDLFLMKSTPNFEGLKFALLDPYSRVFSLNRYAKHDKSSNYVIDKIFLKGIDAPIELGDGLNSIIGPRGSGKSYLLNSLIGNTDKYIDSEIKKQISLDKVVLEGGYSFNFLERQHYDIITQKNSSLGENSLNIYNLLSEAPYNYDKFSQGLSSNFSQEKTEKKMIDGFFSLINYQIKNFINAEKYRNTAPDLSTIRDYNKHYSNQNVDTLINTKFMELFQLLEKSLSSKTAKIKMVDEIKDGIDTTIVEIDKISKYKEVEDIGLKDYVTMFNDNLKGYDNIIHKPIRKKLETDYNRIEKILVIVKSINSKIREKSSNVELVLNDNMTSIIKYINDSSKILREIKNTEKELERFNEDLVDKTEYSFSQEEFSYVIKLEKIFSWSKLSERDISEIFYKYREQLTLKDTAIKDLFMINDFGKSYINLYSSIDNRYKDPSLKKIDKDFKVYLNINNKGFVAWDTLSPGERSDILLNIILDTSSKRILIIDQPEDDLDNEMIYKTIVKKLRKLKHKKQIIAVSHNANVVITGDSDTIINCQNFNNIFKISADVLESKQKHNYSSINTDLMNETMLNIASLILDGGREALKRRVRKFGYKNLFFERE